MITLLSIVVAAALADKPRSVALVDRVKGTATLQRAGAAKIRQIAKTRLISLYSGDKIQVSQGTIVVGFFQNSRWQELGPGAYHVEDNRCRCMSGDAEIKELPAPKALPSPTLNDSWAPLQEGTGQGAALVARGEERAESRPPQVLPISGETVVTDRPHFAWLAVEKVHRYTLRLKVAGSGRVLWKAEASRNELDYPADRPPLTRNRKYTWEVTPTLDKDGFAQPICSSEFTVDSEWDENDLRELKDSAECEQPWRVLLAISCYQSFGLEQAALAASRHLVELVPDDADAWRLLAANLARAGREGEAKEARVKASKLASDE